MNYILTIFLLFALFGCASSPSQNIGWARDSTSEAQVEEDLRDCSEVAAKVLKKSSKKLYRGSGSTARSSSTQVNDKNEGFEDTPHNRKIVRNHCMEKKHYTKSSK